MTSFGGLYSAWTREQAVGARDTGRSPHKAAYTRLSTVPCTAMCELGFTMEHRQANAIMFTDPIACVVSHLLDLAAISSRALLIDPLLPSIMAWHPQALCVAVGPYPCMKT